VSRLVHALVLTAALILTVAPAHGQAPRWWKGNLHTHTFWSDGDDFPEMVAGWYKDHGYHFLALSDHNIMLEGEKWLTVTNAARRRTLAKYIERFGKEWVEQRTNQVRLKTLIEFRKLLEEPNRFLMIPSQEITAMLTVHINASNLKEFIKPRLGSNTLEVMQLNVDAVLEQRARTGQPMFPHINHPNFGHAITAEDLMRVKGEKFFEVYNGHAQVHSFGHKGHPGLDTVWDIVLAHRLSDLNLGVMYGVGVDDSHHYHTMTVSNSNPGRGWVVVRAPELTADAIIKAMEAGDFYASSGVRLMDVRFRTNTLSIEIEPAEGVTYTTQFIGTRKNFDRTSSPGVSLVGKRVTRQYSADIGEVFAVRRGTTAEYTLTGNELYVRAKVISSKLKDNPHAPGEKETAWTQPIPGR
jgi:predicted metal-dependent phosphoesterase TrpH